MLPLGLICFPADPRLRSGWGTYASKDECLQEGGVAVAGGVDPGTYPPPAIPADTGCNYNPRSISRTDPNNACPHLLPDVK